MQPVTAKLVEVDQELDEADEISLKDRLTVKDLALAQSIAERNAIEAKLAEAEAVHTGEMGYAEELRSRAAYGANEYRAQLEQKLSEYKSQRAWTAMLLIRKAYTLLFRRGLR